MLTGLVITIISIIVGAIVRSKPQKSTRVSMLGAPPDPLLVPTRLPGKPRKIAALVEGERVAVTGRVRALQQITAPHSRRQCVGVVSLVERPVFVPAGRSSMVEEEPIRICVSKATNFEIVDGDAAIVVEGRHVDIVLPWDWYGTEGQSASSIGSGIAESRSRDLGFQTGLGSASEAVFDDGAEVTITGDVRRTKAGLRISGTDPSPVVIRAPMPALP